MALFRSLIQWLHLFIVVGVVVSLSLAQAVVRIVYRLFPFKSLLDRIWLDPRASYLRRFFSYKLGDDESKRTGKARLQLTAREMVEREGFQFEEHAVTTADGYVLGLQRIIVTEGEEDDDEDEDGSASINNDNDNDNDAASTVFSSVRSTAAAAARLSRGVTLGKSLRNAGRPPILLQHGLMQCSEAWLVEDRDRRAEGKPRTRRSLAFFLAEAGFDVWLSNVRGNKYSQSHTTLPVESDAFWNFSLDDFATYDLPAVVDHIIEHTNGFAKVGYVGFSQGTAMCFAGLSTNSALNSKISCFVALSPAVAVKGLSRSPVTSLVEADLSFINLLFGRRRMLPLAVDLQKSLSSTAWVNIIDASLLYLFAWKSENIDRKFKEAAFHHLYSFTSVRSTLHWFQLIASGRFARYQSASQGLASPVASIPVIGPLLALFTPTFSGAGGLPFLGSSVGASTVSSHAVPPLYDTKKVSVPIYAFAGGADTIIDIPRLISLLPRQSGRVAIPHGYPSSHDFNASLAQAVVAASAAFVASDANANSSSAAGQASPPYRYSPESSSYYRAPPSPLQLASAMSSGDDSIGADGEWRATSRSTTDKTAYRDFTLAAAEASVNAATGVEDSISGGSGSPSSQPQPHLLQDTRKRSGSTLQLLAAAVHDAVGGYAEHGRDPMPEKPSARLLQDAALHPESYLSHSSSVPAAAADHHHHYHHQRARRSSSIQAAAPHGHGHSHGHSRALSSNILVMDASHQQDLRNRRPGAFGFLSGHATSAAVAASKQHQHQQPPTPTADSAATSTAGRMMRSAVAARIDQYLERPSWPATAFKLPEEEHEQGEGEGGEGEGNAVTAAHGGSEGENQQQHHQQRLLDTSIGGASQLSSFSAAQARRVQEQQHPLYRFERQELFVIIEKSHEHLDPLWAASSAASIFPAVACILQRYAHTQFIDLAPEQQQQQQNNQQPLPRASPRGGGGDRNDSSRMESPHGSSSRPQLGGGQNQPSRARGGRGAGQGQGQGQGRRHQNMPVDATRTPSGDASTGATDGDVTGAVSGSGSALGNTLSSGGFIARHLTHGPDVGASPNTSAAVAKKAEPLKAGAEGTSEDEAENDLAAEQEQNSSASPLPDLPASRAASRGNSFSSPTHGSSLSALQALPPPSLPAPSFASSVGAAMMLSSSSSSSAPAPAPALDGGYLLRPQPQALEVMSSVRSNSSAATSSSSGSSSFTSLLSAVNKDLGALSSDVRQMATRRGGGAGVGVGVGGGMALLTGRADEHGSASSSSSSSSPSSSSLITLSSPSAAGTEGGAGTGTGGPAPAAASGAFLANEKARVLVGGVPLPSLASASSASSSSSSSSSSYGGLSRPFEDPTAAPSTTSPNSSVSLSEPVRPAAAKSGLPSSASAPASSSSSSSLAPLTAKQAVTKAFLNTALGVGNSRKGRL